MLSYCRNTRQAARRVGTPVTAQRSTASIAASATVVEEATRRQESAIAELESFIEELSATAQSSDPVDGGPASVTPSVLDEVALATEDEKITDNELEAYLKEPRSANRVNLLAFWSVSKRLPPLWRPNQC